MAKKAKAKPKPKKALASVSPRTRKLNRKLSKAKAKKEAHSKGPIASGFKLVAGVFAIFKRFWKTLGGIVLVYVILNILFYAGLTNLGTTVTSIKSDISGSGSHVLTALRGIGSLTVSSLGSGSQEGSVAQSVLFVLESLVIIWALRQLLAGKALKVKEAYYQSTTPLVPFVLVLAVIIIQLLPVTLGATILAYVLTSLLSASGLATAIFIFVFILLATWSARMVSGSIFALYIVTLPDMQPRQALRSSKNLVQFRRLSVLRRLLFLPIVIFLIMAVIVVPLILFASWFVAPVFYLLSMLCVLFIHSYLYSLYRSLLE